MKLYVIRHGETENNVLKVVQGITDSPLTDYGREQAKKLKYLIKEKKIDYVVSSPLGRAKETAELLIDNLPINIDDRIIERNWGLCEQVELDIVDKVNCWNYYLNIKDNAIEPVQDFIKRIQEFLWELRLKHEQENVLLITHSAVLRAIYFIVNGIPEDGDLTNLKIPNLSIMEYEI